jgi:transcriptional regulator with PAS, ATPase and Fis domain
MATDSKLWWEISGLVSNVLFNFEAFQGMLANNDVLEAQFNLVNDGVLIINAEQSVTKLNKTAEILFNTTSANAVGKKITDILGAKNSHFMTAVAEVVNKAPFASMVKASITIHTGSAVASDKPS